MRKKAEVLKQSTEKQTKKKKDKKRYLRLLEIFKNQWEFQKSVKIKTIMENLKIQMYPILPSDYSKYLYAKVYKVRCASLI